MNRSSDCEDTRNLPAITIHSFILFLSSVLALAGNSLVCLAFLRNRRLRTITNCYVFSLGITDLITTLFGYSFSAVASSLRKWPFGFNYCQFQGFLLYIWALGSTGILALTAVNRYFCIVKPQYYPTLFTKKKTVFSILFVWLFTLITCLPANFLASVSYQWHPHFTFCQVTSFRAEKILAFTLGSAFVAIPMCIILYCYGSVYRAIRRHNSAVIPSLQEENMRGTERTHEVQVSRVLLAAVFACWICWIPGTVVQLLQTVSQLSVPSFWKSFTALACACSLWINPIIYGVMNRAFRKEFLKLLRC